MQVFYMLRITALLLILTLFLTQLPFTNVEAENAVEITHHSGVVESKEIDPRADVLKDYLAKYNSPLQNNAQDFIDAADTYDVDWKLVPAISGVESTFGKFTPGGFNGWGWGVYGDNRIYFKSWREAIFTITKGLKDGYIDKGLTDPYSMNRKYAASPHWGTKVSHFMNDIEKFQKNATIEPTVTNINPVPFSLSAELMPKVKDTPGFLNI